MRGRAAAEEEGPHREHDDGHRSEEGTLAVAPQGTGGPVCWSTDARHCSSGKGPGTGGGLNPQEAEDCGYSGLGRTVVAGNHMDYLVKSATSLLSDML